MTNTTAQKPRTETPAPRDPGQTRAYALAECLTERACRVMVEQNLPTLRDALDAVLSEVGAPPPADVGKTTRIPRETMATVIDERRR